MYEELKGINKKPKPYEFYTAEVLWNDQHTSAKMLEYHLNQESVLASRREEFIERSVRWMVDKFKIRESTKIADFGCGPGLYAWRLAEAGADVTGIDISGRSIDYAKKEAEKKGLDIEYVQQNYLEYESDRKFDLILMIYCDLCPLSPEQRQVMLSKYTELLKDDGRIVLDVFTIKAFNNREEFAVYDHLLLNGFWSSEDYYGFLNTFKYENEKVVVDKYTIIEKNRSREVYNWLKYFSRESIAKEFGNSGLVVEEYYADVAGSPFDENAEEMAVVARKK